MQIISPGCANSAQIVAENPADKALLLKVTQDYPRDEDQTDFSSPPFDQVQEEHTKKGWDKPLKRWKWDRYDEASGILHICAYLF